MTRCDDQEYEVTFLVPHVYRVTASDAEDAKEQAAKRYAYAVKADAMGFPEAMTVKLVDSPVTVGRLAGAVSPTKE